jgi:soluble lytic murein transglycosylase-like protein
VLLFLTAGSLLAGEQVILRSGFRIQVIRHEVAGGVLKLHSGGGVIEIPLAEVEGIEKEEELPPVPLPEPAVETPAAPAPPPDAKQLIDQAAEKWGLPAEFLHSVARVESGYRPDAVSPKGAIGIMQLMPATAALLEADPRDPAQNVDAGARHLRDLLLRYDGQTGKALAAYNAGAKAVERYGGIPPYSETQLYVQKVLWQFHRLSKQSGKQ